MSNAIAAVKFKNHGINDKSVEPKPPASDAVAQFTPLLPLLTEKGPSDIQVISAEYFIDIYGAKTLDEHGPYYTHQTALLVECIRKGISTIGVKRIIPVGALTGSLSIGVDTTFPESWFLGNIRYVKEDSTYTPLMDFDTSSVGRWGNDYGISIAPTNLLESLRVGLSDDTKIYKFRLIRYDARNTRPTTIPNKYGELETFFTFNPDSVGAGNISYYFNDIIHSSYVGVIDDATSANILAKAELYPNNFKKTLKTSPHYDDTKPYWNQDLNKIFNHELSGSALFDGNMPLMFSGGNDGNIDGNGSFIEKALAKLKAYDDGVFEFLMSLDDTNYFTDPAKYPYSTFVDTGFSFRTKLAAAKLINTRQDCWALIGTYSEGDYVVGNDKKEHFTLVPNLTEQQRQAVASRLLSAFRLYPESHWFGTPACRVVLMKNTGVRENSQYTKRQSMTVYLAGMLVAFMGSPDCAWREQHAPDSETNRVVSGWKDIDVGYQSPTVREFDATNTITAIENYNHRYKYIPVYRTIYSNPTSVLSDFFTMAAGCYIARVGHEAWRQYVNVRMSTQKRVEAVAEFISKRCDNKFNGRFEIIPRVGVDERGVVMERVVVELYSTVTRTTASFNIDAYRNTE